MREWIEKDGVCLCVCVCVRERERERERVKLNDKRRDRNSKCLKEERV